MEKESKMERMVKQDINFLEYPLWMLDEKLKEGFVFKDRDGFVYRTGYKPPVKTDMIFLYYLLLESQKDNWNELVETTYYQVLHGCGIIPGKTWRTRFQDSLRRWASILIEFKGSFYDGKCYKSIGFHIIDHWKIEETGLKIKFSSDWLLQVRHSNFFKYLDFDKIVKLRSPLAIRLYEILTKSFQGRASWNIDAKKLANKIPMKEIYPSDIIPRIKSSIARINEHTDLQISLKVKRPQRGKAILSFRKARASSDSLPLEVEEVNDDLSSLLKLLPESQQKKKTIQSMIVLSLEGNERSYIERNILYTNLHAKKNYRVYLTKALKEDWGSSWWEEHVEEDEEREFVQKEQIENIEVFRQELESELDICVQEFLSLASEEELENISVYVEDKVKMTTTVDSEDFEYLKVNQLVHLLKKGIQYYRSCV